MKTAFIGGTGLHLDWPYAEAIDLDVGQRPTTVSHQGRIEISEGLINVCGRVHAYESGSTAAMAPLYDWLAAQGVGRIILSGAVGSMDAGLPPGQWVEVRDHLFFGGVSPLVGTPNAFVEMADAYAQGWSDLPPAIYAWTHGPQLETRAEISALKALGGQVVGMSMAPEAILARHHQMQVYGLACVVNWAAGQGPQTTVAAMLAQGQQASKALPDLVRRVMAHP